MQTTRFTSIGSRVEIATLMLVRTVTSKNPSTRPGRTCLTWAQLLRRLGDRRRPTRAGRRRTCTRPPPRTGRPAARNSASTPSSIPRNLPTMNWRRLIGLESSVIAVLPSISSATVELAVKQRQQQADERDRRQPRVLVHLDVFAEREVRHEDRHDQKRSGEERQDEEGRLADRLLGGRECDGE